MTVGQWRRGRATHRAGELPRLLILTLIFPPDGVSTAQLLGEIAQDLHGATFDVSVITTQPHYNCDCEARANQPIQWAWHRMVGRSHFHDIAVTHVRMPDKAAGRVRRGLQWAWFHFASLPLALLRARPDVVLAVSPPPSIALVARAVRLLRGTPFVLALWELYPEILVRLGKLRRGSIAHRVLRWLERRTYERAAAIAVLHDEMGEMVARSLPSIRDRIRVVPTFADTDFLRPLDRNTTLRRELGLADRFVVGYAGNLGVSQDLTSLLEAAHLLRDTPIAFLIAGDGTERSKLEELAAKLDLPNVRFTGHLPYSRVPEITATCDLCIVSLAAGVSAEALPSKVYRIMACGRPVLAIADESGPLAQLVNGSGTGTTCRPDDPAALAASIAALSEAPEQITGLGTRAREVALASFSRSAVISRYSALLTAARSGVGEVGPDVQGPSANDVVSNA